MNGIKVTIREERYIDFIIFSDEQNVYRYIYGDDTFHKLIGFGKGNFGKAIRGNERKKLNEIVKYVFENKLPFAIIA